MFSHDEKRELLAIARDAIERALKGAQASRHASAAALAQHSGAFVTIRIEGELRGCIGYIESERALGDVVAEVAVKAATEDLRFPPMTLAEFECASLEVSVLTPLVRIHSVEEIEVGKHGIVVALGARRGLLLPQVATEHHLDREAFLNATIRKAGLSISMSRLPELELYVFEADVIHDADVVHS